MISQDETFLSGELLVPGSRLSGGRSDSFVEASEGKSVSRNASEPVSAPLRSGSGQPASSGEASDVEIRMNPITFITSCEELFPCRFPLRK